MDTVAIIKTIDFSAIYREFVDKHGLKIDDNQLIFSDILNQLYNDLLSTKSHVSLLSFLTFWRKKKLNDNAREPKKGFYLWGDVGRGKTMMMDLFIDSIPNKKIVRRHFHAFMQETHAQINAARAKHIKDPIQPVLNQISSQADVLALDEMFITDITDAMLIGRLVKGLVERGVFFVTSSNLKPTWLYKDGINRDLFLPFIEFIESQLLVFNLDHPVDYRKQVISTSERFFSPDDEIATAKIDEIWQKATLENRTFKHGCHGLTITNQGRTWTIESFVNGVARCHFDSLCKEPLAASDYLQLVGYLKLLLLEHIPKMDGKSQHSKRFIVLVDILHENNIKLFASLESGIDEIFNDDNDRPDVKRTLSRLHKLAITQ